jgi:hypothetical protein
MLSVVEHEATLTNLIPASMRMLGAPMCVPVSAGPTSRERSAIIHLSPCHRLADSVAKVFLSHRSQLFRAVGAAIEYIDVGDTSFCDELTEDFGGWFEAASIDVAACFVLLAEIRRAAFWDFCNKIGT